MNQKMSIKKGVFEDFWKIDESVKQRDRFETCWTLPKEIGTGTFCKIKLQPGFDLYVADCEFQEDVVINVDDCELSVFGFGFLVSGGLKSKIHNMKGDFFMGSGQNELLYFPHQNALREGEKKRHISGVSVLIEPHLFYALAEGEFDRVSADFRGIADGTEEKNYYRIDTNTPSIKATIHQTLNCPYYGLTRRLFLESKALELIAYKLEQLVSAESKINKKIVLRPNDIERIHHAKELLIRDLENPPKLYELARSVGLSHPKLNFYFREMYGSTLFDYLRIIRLKEAKRLLDEGKMNVTEVAFSVGYSSPSYFTQAFKQHFGIPPSIYLREVDKRRHYSFSP